MLGAAGRQQFVSAVVKSAGRSTTKDIADAGTVLVRAVDGSDRESSASACAGHGLDVVGVAPIAVNQHLLSV